MYIFVLGYDVDFGHMEAISLMLSQKYPEKVVGYAAVALMVHPLEVNNRFCFLKGNLLGIQRIGFAATVDG